MNLVGGIFAEEKSILVIQASQRTAKAGGELSTEKLILDSTVLR